MTEPITLLLAQVRGVTTACDFYPSNNLMELAATFEEGIAVFVAIGTAGLAAVRSNKWLFSKYIDVVYVLETFGTLHAVCYKQADRFTEWLLSEVPLYYVISLRKGTTWERW